MEKEIRNKMSLGIPLTEEEEAEFILRHRSRGFAMACRQKGGNKMTNAEKYKKEIKEIVKPYVRAEHALAYNIKTNELTRCGSIIDCGDCLFSKKNNKDKVATCMENCKDWLQSEYEEDTKKDTINKAPNEDECEYIGVAQKVKQLLFVEDGSVDMFHLYSQLSGKPEIAIIVYRKGSRTPVLANLEE